MVKLIDKILAWIEIKSSKINNWAWDKRWKSRGTNEWIKGYKKAVKSFQTKYSKLKEVMVEWYKNKKLNHKLQKLPLGRKKKISKW